MRQKNYAIDVVIDFGSYKVLRKKPSQTKQIMIWLAACRYLPMSRLAKELGRNYGVA
jgi:hypothetical protein